jgi:mRNA interferase MazF
MPLPEPKRGEVWRVDFEPSRGAEIQKTRPAVVLNLDSIGKLPLRVVVPFTRWQPNFSEVRWLVKIVPAASNGLSKDSAADAFQMRSFAVERFVEKIGTLTPRQMEAIGRAAAEVLGCPLTK